MNANWIQTHRWGNPQRGSAHGWTCSVCGATKRTTKDKRGRMRTEVSADCAGRYRLDVGARGRIALLREVGIYSAVEIASDGCYEVERSDAAKAAWPERKLATWLDCPDEMIRVEAKRLAELLAALGEMSAPQVIS